MISIQLYNEDCLKTLSRIPAGSIDLIMQDTPYEVTENAWDIAPDFPVMWPEWLRVIKPNGAIIFTAQQPFTTDLINSNRKHFRYSLVWNKISGTTGFLNANRMPLRAHEDILVFYQSLPVYNPQKVRGKPNHSKGKPNEKKKQTTSNYGKYDGNFQGEITHDKHPTSIIEIPVVPPSKSVHPTEKPVDLIRWFIRTYTNRGGGSVRWVFRSVSYRCCMRYGRALIHWC